MEQRPWPALLADARRGSGDEIRIVGFAGSLRAASLNRGLLRAAIELAPADCVIEPFDLRGVPLYDEDLRHAGPPEAVQELKSRLAAADGLLICTPEYNNSFSPVTKNAIDWISRPTAESPLRELPVGIMGASDGHFGTARAQAALRVVLAATGANVMSKPLFLVWRGLEHADEQGNLVDADQRQRLEQYMAALVDWIRRVRVTTATEGANR
jgi:chromate reductase